MPVGANSRRASSSSAPVDPADTTFPPRLTFKLGINRTKFFFIFFYLGIYLRRPVSPVNRDRLYLHRWFVNLNGSLYCSVLENGVRKNGAASLSLQRVCSIPAKDALSLIITMPFICMRRRNERRTTLLDNFCLTVGNCRHSNFGGCKTIFKSRYAQGQKTSHSLTHTLSISPPSLTYMGEC